MHMGMGLSNLNSSPIGAAANPPYIRFETRMVQKFKLASEGGAPYNTDVDYALVTSHGSKDTVEKVALEWFEHLKSEVMQQRMPGYWLESYMASYRAWKSGQELPVNGTPIKNWPLLSPAEAKTLNELGIRAVEDLALANEELVGRIGMGGRALCQRAKDWVQSAKDQAPLVMELESQKGINAQLEQRVRDMEQVIAGLSRAATAVAPVPEASPYTLEERLHASQRGETISEGEMVDDVIKDLAD